MDQMMDVIKKRMSIRAYQDQGLPAELLESLLEAAQNAPTARNAQELEYKVITNKTLSQKISDHIRAILQKEMPFPDRPPGLPQPFRPHLFYNAPAVIIVVGPRENTWVDSDAALGVQNIMLYATSRGLGSCFIGMARFIEKDPALLQELHITEGQRIAACVVVGFPDEKPEPKIKTLKVEYFR
jgi:nitroreductase